MKTWLRNVFYLSIKELKSVLSDVTLMGLVIAVFTVAIYTVSEGVTTEIKHASVAVIDNDRSDLSYRLRDAFMAPQFKSPVLISYAERERDMDSGKYSFILEIPSGFAADVLAGKSPKLQLLVDATASTLAGVGTGYIRQIIDQEVNQYLSSPGLSALLPFTPVVSIMYNPNGETVWYLSVIQVVVNVTLLSMILVGAAVIREREHGTIEHLLVMPVHASEIAISKILTNSLLILLAALMALGFTVHTLLGVPILGSIPLFVLGTVVYLFTVSSLGVWLATLAPTMPQFGLLCLPIYVVTRLLSGSETPLESMPLLVQKLTFFSPVTQFVLFSQNVLFRDAGLNIVWSQLLILAVVGVLFLVLALSRFRSMLSKQG